MYSEKIDALIKAALADGDMTEKEKQILFKAAEAEGVDLDEFEMVLNAKLFEKQSEAKAAAAAAAAAAVPPPAPSAPKSNKFGDIRKCPACGSLLNSFQHKCDDCGYEFTHVEAVESAQKLFDLLQAAELRKTQKLQEHEENKLEKLREFEKEKTRSLNELSARHSSDSGFVKILGGAKRLEAQDEERDDLIETLEESRRQLIKSMEKESKNIEAQFSNEKATIIKSFPVPNTKEDLLELLAMATSSAYDNDGVVGKEEEVWIQKVDQIYQKVLACAGNDNAFIDQASTMVISLIRRLPGKYKNFTRLHDRAKSKLVEEENNVRQLKKAAMIAVLKYMGPICGVMVLLMIIGAFVDGLGFIGFLGLAVSIAITIVLIKKRFQAIQ